MPSDRAWLRSQGLGLVCGFGTVLLLATGSVVLVATREGASSSIGLDDLRAFFTRPSAVHLWLYLLLPLAGLYAVDTVLGTWDNVARRWRAGQRAPSAYAAAVIHLGFLLALVAHAAGGFLSEDRGAVLVASGWQPLPGFGEARLAGLAVDTLPGGMPRSVRAALEVRGQDGAIEVAEVGYNRPRTAGLGARLAILQEQGQAAVARLASGEVRCALAPGQSCRVGEEEVELLALGQVPGTGAAAASLRAPDPEGRQVVRWVAAGELLALRGGRPLQLLSVGPEPAVLLRVRESPGNPWALAAAVVLALGSALLWRRLLWR